MRNEKGNTMTNVEVKAGVRGARCELNYESRINELRTKN